MGKDSPELRDLGKRVRQAREGAGLGQADVATRIGRSRSTIANIESGRQGDIGATVLTALAHALGVTVAELVGESATIQVPHVSVRYMVGVDCDECGHVGSADSITAARAMRVDHIETDHLFRRSRG